MTLISRLVACVCLLPSARAAESAVLSPDEGLKLAAYVRKAFGDPNGWEVESRGNSIVVKRLKPVPIIDIVPNAPWMWNAPAQKPDREVAVSYSLRMAPKMSRAEYDRLAAINAASANEYHRLKLAVNVSHKFDEFVPTTPEEKARVKAFREAAAKLPRHELPQLYSLDHSVFVTLPLDGWSYFAPGAASDECRAVEASLSRLFGVYDSGLASEERLPGHHPSPKR